MASETRRDELVAEYKQYSPIELANLAKLLESDIENYDESIAEATTKEWKAYWQGMKRDAQLELSVCQEFLVQVAG